MRLEVMGYTQGRELWGIPTEQNFHETDQRALKNQGVFSSIFPLKNATKML